MRSALLAATVAVLAVSAHGVSDSPAQRAKTMLARMNQTEKVAMLHGYDGPYVGNMAGNTRLGIPSINMNDGPQGFRGEDGTSTCWPSGMTMATTWNTSAMEAWGAAMGLEFAQKGANVQLGPGVNVARVPTNGRNFEYLSGEDPFLGYTLVKPVVQGIQSQGVIANAKHYVNNNQETNRQTVSANLDERTQWELYMPPFAGAVEAGVLSIMCSYNRINDVYACENDETLNVNLKQRLGFTGWVMSDWGATHSTVLAANSGLDQEEPSDEYFGDALFDAVQSGEVTQTTLDDKVLRILTAMYAAGLFDRAPSGDINANVTSDAHNALARQFAAESTVLLKNDDNILPLDETQTIAVIGDACGDKAIVHGGGSGQVIPAYVITPMNGIASRTPATVKYYGSSNVEAAVAGAANATVAIVCTATTSCEGSDRANLSLPWNEDLLIEAVAKAQPKTIVSIVSPGAVLMPWADNVAAILSTFMPGQEAGNALADVLFGDVNPSGKLPMTFPMKENQVGFTQDQYPGLPADNPIEANYTEKLLVGYRWYDAHNSAPRYPFGHGLSYTTFTYTSLMATKDRVSVLVKNTGSVAGAEVPQMYLGFPTSSGEPPQQLKGFSKVFLGPGESATVNFPLTPRDLSIWDVETHSYAPQSGTFLVYVGASSRDIRLKGTFAA